MSCPFDEKSRVLYTRLVAADRVVCHLRHARERAGMSQAALAQQVGVSRQALIAIEAGRQVPSTVLALQLARALGCRVEDLFTIGPSDAIEVELASGEAGERVAIARVRGRWVAHGVGCSPRGADGVLAGASAVRPLDAPAALSRNVLIAGCAPLLATLADWTSRRQREARVRWVHANSRRALDLLARDQVHAAGLHAGGDGDNLALVRERFGRERMIVVHLTRWRQGLVVAPKNPLAIREAADLVRRDVRAARREDGAGAAKLLERTLRSTRRKPRGPLAASHEEVAQLVRCGAADAGVAIESVALSMGLGFVPLAEERFDLVLREEVASEEPASRVLDALADASFRADACALPGYDASRAGEARRSA